MIDFSTLTDPHLGSDANCGYGHAYSKIRDNIDRAADGCNFIEIANEYVNADIGLYFGPFPVPNAHSPNQVKIHMSSHETTHFDKGRGEGYLTADDFWTPGVMGETAARNYGVPDEKIYLFPHGVDGSVFSATPRGGGSEIKFLHMDSGSGRRRAYLAIQCFRDAFQGNPNYELTLHYKGGNDHSDWTHENVLNTGGEWIERNIRCINKTLTSHELVAVMHFHDVLLYPSEGEGFGLIPLQALATGMPIISTAKWSSYSHFYQDTIIESSWGNSGSDWGYPHVGLHEVIDTDSVVSHLRAVAGDIDAVARKFLAQRDSVIAEFDWLKSCRAALDRAHQVYLRSRG